MNYFVSRFLWWSKNSQVLHIPFYFRTRHCSLGFYLFSYVCIVLSFASVFEED